MRRKDSDIICEVEEIILSSRDIHKPVRVDFVQYNRDGSRGTRKSFYYNVIPPGITGGGLYTLSFLKRFL